MLSVRFLVIRPWGHILQRHFKAYLMSRCPLFKGAVEWALLWLQLSSWVCICDLQGFVYSLWSENDCDWIWCQTEVCQRRSAVEQLSLHPQLGSVAWHSSPFHIHTKLRDSNTQPLLPERQEMRPASCDSPLSCGHFLVFGSCC